MDTLNMKNAKTAIWLVKVPKRIADCWANGEPGSEIGTMSFLKQANSRNPARFFFNMNQSLFNDKNESLQREMQVAKDFSISNNNWSVISSESIQSDPNGLESMPVSRHPPAVEGRVKQRFEFKPPVMDEQYENMFKSKVETANKPVREIIHLDRAVTDFRPTNDHGFNRRMKNAKKEEVKKVRFDKEKVKETLFLAFEKHQYYNIKALVEITQQPLDFLKMILKEICVFNIKGEHKFTWELKPEYRHYKSK